MEEFVKAPSRIIKLKKQTEFVKAPSRIIKLKKHIDEIVAEFCSSCDIDEAIRCVSFYNHEVVTRIIAISFDYGNRERDLTSQFLGLLSLFICRAIVDEVLPANLMDNQHYLLETYMAYPQHP